MSFKKAAINQAAAHPTHHLYSSGLDDLDSIHNCTCIYHYSALSICCSADCLGGGFPQGSIALVEEDLNTHHYLTLQKYFLAYDNNVQPYFEDTSHRSLLTLSLFFQ